jgi:hypothetical protein
MATGPKQKGEDPGTKNDSGVVDLDKNSFLL